jgi:6-pyruvoyltetrahydropterin/6-carboxytetrahydropterin synthase
MTTRFVRARSFSAAHRFADHRLSEEENRKAYGSLFKGLSRDRGFGHNFHIEFHFQGEIDPLSGMVANLVNVDEWLEQTLATLDHKDLNEINEFSGVVPTPERITRYCFDHVSEAMARSGLASKSTRLVKVRLYEGDDHWIDVEADVG